MKKPKIPCPRCGRRIAAEPKYQLFHQRSCERIPVPCELAQVFLDDETITVSQLVREYETSNGAIRHHIVQGLRQMGYGLKEADALIKQRASRGRRDQGDAKKKQQSKKKDGYYSCQRCQVVVRGRLLCDICAGVRPYDYHGHTYERVY